MKTVYLISVMIPSFLYTNCLKYLISNDREFHPNGNAYSGIYAWTNSESDLKEFLEVRDKSIYNVIPIEFNSKEEYKSFKIDNKELKLDYRTYDRPKECGGPIQVLTTFNEYIQSTEYSEENLNEFLFSFLNDSYDYEIFSDEVIDSLDVLNFTQEYDKRCEDEERRDLAEYNGSYGVTTRGNNIIIETSNELNILLHLYRYFFYGSEKELVS